MPGGEYQLSLIDKLEEDPILLARKPISHHSAEEGPSNPSRAYFCVWEEDRPMWFRVHLGHFAPKPHQAFPNPRLYMEGEPGFTFASSRSQVPEASHRVVPGIRTLQICRVFFDGRSLLGLDIARQGQTEIRLRVLVSRCQVLHLVIAPLQVGSREFQIPGEDAIQVYSSGEVR